MTASLLAAICKIGMLASSLFTYHDFACPGDWLSLTCPQHSQIKIRWAEFGYLSSTSINCLGEFKNQTKRTDCLAENSLRVVTDECDERQTCRLKAVPKSFSSARSDSTRSAANNANGGKTGQTALTCSYNQLEVGYQCIPTFIKNETFCYGETMKILCPLNLVIAFSATMFGYLKEDKHRCSHGPAYHADCFETCAISIIAARCQGRRSCDVLVARETLGEACRSHTHPYLQISYSCVYRRTLKEGVDWSSMYGCDKTTPTPPQIKFYTLPPRNGNSKEKPDYYSGSVLTNLLAVFVFLSVNLEKLILYALIGFLVGLITILITIIIKLILYICTKRNRKFCASSCVGKPHEHDGNNAQNETESESAKTMPRQVSAELTLGENGGSPIFVHMESPRESPLLGRVARRKPPTKKPKKKKVPTATLR